MMTAAALTMDVTTTNHHHLHSRAQAFLMCTTSQFKIAEFIGAIRGAMERGVNEGGVVTEEMVRRGLGLCDGW
jgi:hypothetical protein